MRAYHGDIKIKEKYLLRVKAHRLADEIVKGIYWQKGKGCAVGCTVHSDDHYAYEKELGIPRKLARLEDGIFEGLPLERAKLWPEEFLNAINVGADLSSIWPKFAIWLLTAPEHGVIKFAINDQQRKVIQNIADLYADYENVTFKEWQQASHAANAVAGACTYADRADGFEAAHASADVAAYAAAAIISTSTYTADAAHAAADAAAYAVDVAGAYAYAAGACTDAAAAHAAYVAGYAADAAAREKARIVQSEKLLELLQECK